MEASSVFRRGSDVRRSLPANTHANRSVAAIASRSFTRSPVVAAAGSGLLFLTYSGETRKSILPGAVDSMAVVWSLFNQAFPRLARSELTADQYQVYIHDRVADRFFLLTCLLDINDGTMLKLVAMGPGSTRASASAAWPCFDIAIGMTATHIHATHNSDGPLLGGNGTGTSERHRAKARAELGTVGRRLVTAEQAAEALSSSCGSGSSINSDASEDDSYTRNRVAMLEAQLSRLTLWVQTALASTDGAFGDDGLAVLPPAHRRTLAEGSVTDPVKSNGMAHKMLLRKDSQAYQTALRRLMCQARDLKMEIRSLRHIHQAQAESMTEQFTEIRRQILAALGHIVSSSRARQPLLECMQTDGSLSRHQSNMNRLEQQLGDVERCVEELRRKVVTQRAAIDSAEIEAYAEHLCTASRSAADVSASLQHLSRGIRSSSAAELSQAAEQQRFMEEEPRRLDSSIARIKELTLALTALERLASTSGAYAYDSSGSLPACGGGSSAPSAGSLMPDRRATSRRPAVLRSSSAAHRGNANGDRRLEGSRTTDAGCASGSAGPSQRPQPEVETAATLSAENAKLPTACTSQRRNSHPVEQPGAAVHDCWRDGSIAAEASVPTKRPTDGCSTAALDRSEIASISGSMASPVPANDEDDGYHDGGSSSSSDGSSCAALGDRAPSGISPSFQTVQSNHDASTFLGAERSRTAPQVVLTDGMVHRADVAVPECLPLESDSPLPPAREPEAGRLLSPLLLLPPAECQALSRERPAAADRGPEQAIHHVPNGQKRSSDSDHCLTTGTGLVSTGVPWQQQMPAESAPQSIDADSGACGGGRSEQARVAGGTWRPASAARSPGMKPPLAPKPTLLSLPQHRLQQQQPRVERPCDALASGARRPLTTAL